MKLLLMPFPSVSRHFVRPWSKYFPQHSVLKHPRVCSSLNTSIREQVSQPYRITDKIIVLYVLILMFLYSRQEYKRFWTEWLHGLPEFSLL
jgi:hypothetical protein